MKTGDTVTVNRTYVDTVLAIRAMSPNLRQTLTTLERLGNTESTVLEQGWSSHPNLGTIMYWIKIVPKDPLHILYRAPQDGPGRGIIVHFTSDADRTSSFHCS